MVEISCWLIHHSAQLKNDDLIFVRNSGARYHGFLEVLLRSDTVFPGYPNGITSLFYTGDSCLRVTL